MIVIRFKQTGTKSRKNWRVVVADRRVPRNGRLIEEIGYYNPLVDPPKLEVNRERYDEWIRKGAKPSSAVKSVMKKEKK